MKVKFVIPVIVLTLFVLFASMGSSSTFTGFLRFPVDGYTASTAPVTAVMDHNDSWNEITTYTGESGSYNDGCLAYVNGQNVACSGANTTYPWSYKRPGGEAWSTPDMNYLDFAPGNEVYMWYDNHRGYDYAIAQWTSVKASAAGTITDINSSLGQVIINHNNGYQTIYSHMYLLQPLPQNINKGQHIGCTFNLLPQHFH